MFEQDRLTNNEFYIIFASSVLEHFEDQESLFNERRGILSKDGLIVFSSTNGTFFMKSNEEFLSIQNQKIIITWFFKLGTRKENISDFIEREMDCKKSYIDYFMLI